MRGQDLDRSIRGNMWDWSNVLWDPGDWSGVSVVIFEVAQKFSRIIWDWSGCMRERTGLDECVFKKVCVLWERTGLVKRVCRNRRDWASGSVGMAGNAQTLKGCLQELMGLVRKVCRSGQDWHNFQWDLVEVVCARAEGIGQALCGKGHDCSILSVGVGGIGQNSSRTEWE